jgi:hypothetical protein
MSRFTGETWAGGLCHFVAISTQLDKTAKGLTAGGENAIFTGYDFAKAKPLHE